MSAYYHVLIQRTRISVGDVPTQRYVLPGRVAEAGGKLAAIEFNGSESGYLEAKVIGSITTTGRGELNSAEKQRGEAVLQVLQGDTQLLDDNPWFQKICFPSNDFSWPPSFSTKSAAPPPDFSALERPLNASQLIAVRRMLSHSNKSRITLIHGPPGTGKTTVIATYVHFALSQGQKGIWLTAQSNVAVKNIAEKLLDSGLTKWKLLVSKDFHLDWSVLFYL